MSNTSALLLRSTDLLRFVPNAQNATTGDFTFRAWDQSGATSGQQGTKVDTSTSGGSSAFSTATEVASITVTAVNDAPVIAGLDGDVRAYTEGSAAVLIGSTSGITDVDSTDFNTGTLTVSFTAGSDSTEDVLGIRNEGTGVGQIGVSGSNVTFGGVVIGTWTGGSNGTNLVITFNANANATNTAALVNNLTYLNTDNDNPTTTNRSIRVVMTDGDGGTSSNNDTTMTVAAVNDAPTFTAIGPSAQSATIAITSDNVYNLYVNGVLVGTHNDWVDIETYTSTLQTGDVVAIEGIDMGGAGAMIAAIDFANGARVVTGADWRISTTFQSGWNTQGFDDSQWQDATAHGDRTSAPGQVASLRTPITADL